MELNTRRSTRRGNLTRGLKGISDPGWHPILMIQIYLMGNALLLRGAVETLGTSATNRALSKQRAVRSKRKMRSDQIRSDMWPNNKSTATEEQLMIELKMKTWYTIIGYHYGRSGLRMLVLIFILLLILIICIVSSTSSTMCVCVCVCFLPIHSGHQVRWTYQPGSHRRKVHRISHPLSFCGACLNLSREKDSAIPFPRRP